MAGKTLCFKGKIVEVTNASEKEIRQGYPEGMYNGGCSCCGDSKSSDCDCGCSDENKNSQGECGCGCGCN